MDYPSPVASVTASGDIDLTNAYTNEIGAWDKVAIAYGYQEFPAGTDEPPALNKIQDFTPAAQRLITLLFGP